MDAKLTPVAPLGAAPVAGAARTGDFARRDSERVSLQKAEREQAPAEAKPESAKLSSNQLLSADLRIEVDKEAERFVQSFSDPVTGEEIRRYPAEAQLAFSRAASAFAKAQSDKLK